MPRLKMADFQQAENVYTLNNAYENSPNMSQFALCRSDWSLERIENMKLFGCRGLNYQGKRIFLWMFFIFAVSDLKSAVQQCNKRRGIF